MYVCNNRASNKNAHLENLLKYTYDTIAMYYVPYTIQ